MRTRTKAALLSAAAATTLLVAVAAPSGAAASKSYAYGVSVNGQGKQPYVESTDGSTQTGGGAIPDQASPLLSGGVMKLTAGNNKASADLVDLGLLNVGDQLPQQLKDGLKQLQPACDAFKQAADGGADAGVAQLNDGIDKAPGGSLIDIPNASQANAFCNSVLSGDIAELVHLQALRVQCTGDSGTVTLAGVEILGAKVPGLKGDVAPNTPVFPDNPGFNVILNRQTPNPDGSFTVDGLVIDAGGGQADVVLASATCGKPIADRKTTNTPPHNAPAPTPVHRSLGVTG